MLRGRANDCLGFVVSYFKRIDLRSRLKLQVHEHQLLRGAFGHGDLLLDHRFPKCLH